MKTYPEQKRTILKALLPLCPFVLVDGTHVGCELPEVLHKKGLVLRLGEDPQVLGIPDLRIDERGFRATLSFAGHRVQVFVPWLAVHRYWIGDPFDGPVIAWPMQFPPDAETPPDGTRTSSGPGLRVVK
jgi:stringent starvation protein B